MHSTNACRQAGAWSARHPGVDANREPDSARRRPVRRRRRPVRHPDRLDLQDDPGADSADSAIPAHRAHPRGWVESGARTTSSCCTGACCREIRHLADRPRRWSARHPALGVHRTRSGTACVLVRELPARVGCSPLSPIPYLRTRRRRGGSRAHPPWASGLAARDAGPLPPTGCARPWQPPEWVEARLHNPQWINEQLKQMSVQGDLLRDHAHPGAPPGRADRPGQGRGGTRPSVRRNSPCSRSREASSAWRSSRLRHHRAHGLRRRPADGASPAAGESKPSCARRRRLPSRK